MTTCIFSALLVRPTDDDDRRTTLFLEPSEAIKLVTRLTSKSKGISFFVRVQMFLYTADENGVKTDRGYDIPESIKVTKAQIDKVLYEKDRFNKRKIEAGQNTGLIEVCRLGDCVFFG